MSWDHTIDASVVRLNKGLLDLAVLHNERITLAAVVSEDRGAVKGHIEGLGEFASRVTKEADLYDQLVRTIELCGKNGGQHTPLLPVGSREVAQALVLLSHRVSQTQNG